MFLTPDTQYFVVPWRLDLAQLIPHARKMAHAGASYLVVPNGAEEAKVARNLGVPMPPPILTRYDWAGRTPWEIQKTTAALLVESPRCYVLSTMGTGKTRSAAWAADYLMRSANLRRVLIAAPLSTLTMVWERELFRILPDRRAVVVYGDRAKRLKLLAQDADFYIINHHGFSVIGDALIARGFDGLIIDELAVFRTKGTDLWKGANAVVQSPTMRFAWGLTGSPTPNAPTDAWAQIRLLTPSRVTRTVSAFKDQTMRQVSPFKWAPRPEANTLVHAAMQPSVRFTLDDVMELPPTVYVDRKVSLEPDAAKAYKMMVDKLRIMTQAGESITAVNEGVLQTKLLQVSLGYIYTDSRKVYQLSSKPREDALTEVIDECDRKVIVFVPFIHALEGVAAALQKAKHTIGVVQGSTSRAMRDRTFAAFQDTDKPRVLVAHPQCMAHGLSLTVANTIIWYSPTDRLDIYEQANARIARPGQTSKTLIVHLVGTAIERVTYARLKAKAKMQGSLLQLFKEQNVEF